MSSRSDGFRLGGVHPTPSSVGSTPLRVNDPTYDSQGKRMSFASNLKRSAPPTSNSMLLAGFQNYIFVLSVIIHHTNVRKELDLEED
jgi:hypothetical protein